MFNRQPFNRGKFNVNTTGESSSFFGDLTFNLNISAKLTVVKSFVGTVDILIKTNGTMIKQRSLIGNVAIKLGLDGQISRTKTITGDIDINLDLVSQNITTSDVNSMRFPKLVLVPGDELVIDTGEMTITLNGQNASRYFSSTSEFFSINPGENIIIYENGNQLSEADIRILWRDSFL